MTTAFSAADFVASQPLPTPSLVGDACRVLTNRILPALHSVGLYPTSIVDADADMVYETLRPIAATALLCTIVHVLLWRRHHARTAVVPKFWWLNAYVFVSIAMWGAVFLLTSGAMSLGCVGGGVNRRHSMLSWLIDLRLLAWSQHSLLMAEFSVFAACLAVQLYVYTSRRFATAVRRVTLQMLKVVLVAHITLFLCEQITPVVVASAIATTIRKPLAFLIGGVEADALGAAAFGGSINIVYACLVLVLLQLDGTVSEQSARLLRSRPIVRTTISFYWLLLVARLLLLLPPAVLVARRSMRHAPLAIALHVAVQTAYHVAPLCARIVRDMPLAIRAVVRADIAMLVRGVSLADVAQFGMSTGQQIAATFGFGSSSSSSSTPTTSAADDDDDDDDEVDQAGDAATTFHMWLRQQRIIGLGVGDGDDDEDAATVPAAAFVHTINGCILLPPPPTTTVTDNSILSAAAAAEHGSLSPPPQLILGRADTADIDARLFVSCSVSSPFAMVVHRNRINADECCGICHERLFVAGTATSAQTETADVAPSTQTETETETADASTSTSTQTADASPSTSVTEAATSAQTEAAAATESTTSAAAAAAVVQMTWCPHRFHRNCIVQWSVQRRLTMQRVSCPICRQGLEEAILHHHGSGM